MRDSYQFIKRRSSFKKLLQNYGNTVAIIPNSTEHIRNSNIYYPYRSNSNFYYLTGFNEPNSCLIMITNTDKDILFCMPNDKHKELWEGSVIGPEATKQLFGFNYAYSINDFENILPNLLKECKSIFLEINRLYVEKNQIFSCLKKTLKKNNNKYINLMDIRPTLSEMRLIKDSSEIKKMKQSAKISANAHKEILHYCTVGMYEYELEAKLLYEFNKNGAREVSYKSIVASGANSCTLHYSKNNSIIKSGDLVLIDAGCELDNYASDITRTFPANGKFSSCQLNLYEIVLEAQKTAIGKAIAGNNFRQPHEEALKIVVQGLIDEKILNGTLDEIIETEAYKNIFPHSTSHWIGIDVHDVGNLYKSNGDSKIWRTLDPGMLLTIEPGIYIRPSDKIPSIFWNIGIRIEDTILVNNEGNEIISQNAPVNPVAIENMMHG